MTHTLHRLGSEDTLKEDFVVLCMPAKGYNTVGSGDKVRRFLEIALASGAIKIGDCRFGNQNTQGGARQVVDHCVDQSVVHAVFRDEESLTRLLQELKKEDLGMSVVVSGLFDHVETCCRRAGLEKHTINQSLGRWGRTDKLPERAVLELNTMCGHGMVTVGLIYSVVEDVRAGRITPEEGAETLFEPCMCGVFNPHRAAVLLRAMASAK